MSGVNSSYSGEASSDVKACSEDCAFSYKLSHIRLGEFDLGGVLYHGNYFNIYESVREELLSESGNPYHSLVNEGLHLAVITADQKFIKPITYGMPVTIILTVKALTKVKVKLKYEFFDSQGNLIHIGHTEHVCVKNSDGRFIPSKFPEEIYKLFSKHLRKTA